jgi:hypothetical protein
VGDQVEEKNMRWRGLDGREDMWRDNAWKTPSGRFLEGEAIAHVDRIKVEINQKTL